MKKIILILGFFTTLLFSSSYEDGLKAYKNSDFKTALLIFEELALKDDLKAQSKLGFMYLYAKGVDVDFNKALSFLEKASNKGDAEAQYHLGLIYFSDLYKKQDYKKSKSSV